MHVVVHGGGAIGLSVAWHLLPHARVTVVDAPRPGAASPAAAGMIAPLVDAWCCFRPGSKDGLPVIGRIDDRTYIATGHYRNGILLAPITGKLLAEMIVGGNTPELLKPCDPLR